ncbi:hypothetical protein GR925_21140 [Streptomyces sp. HUCO-GS316]|uniref:hypothetical protein n=1 Tax=Streptomyces sp. HUCO-GS316 TaxID=2692198 RepID=UPI0013709F02|nr:hypothetical protein [Streptomyces sp. HUCO-GS316]MXM65886.1 hypothetical protein [Streptomyces sp. HUCO-GS316]
MTDLDWVPQSCTLPTEERPLRVAAWDGLLTDRLRRVSRPEPLRLRLDLGSDTGIEARVRDLVGRESGCCAFFDFTVAVDSGAVLLDVAVEQVHAPVLASLAARAGRIADTSETS